MEHVIDENKTYSVSEIASLGLIKPPSGSNNPLTVYQNILKVIKNGDIAYVNRGGFKKEYGILGRDLIAYINEQRKD